MKGLNFIFTLALTLFAVSAYAQPGDVPPNADPGKCYAKCVIADEYETVTEQIETKAATVRTEVVPAQYETVSEQVVAKEESKRLVYVPAEYETVTEQVMVKPETRRMIPVPAEYETVTEQYESEPSFTRIETTPPQYETQTEQIETSPATTKWVKRKADRNCLSADPNDCLVWCLVEVPAQYRTVTRRVNVGCDGSGVPNSGCVNEVTVPAKMATRTRRVLRNPATVREEVIPAEFETITKRVVRTPATVREEVIPAEYATVTKRVVRTPATTREESIPAEYATVSRRVVSSPATTRTIDVPAEYQTLTKRRLVRPGGFTEWREVLCNSDVTTATVRQIQAALRDRGYDPGPVDNVMGAKTKAALTKYQRDNNLPVGNLDFETLKSLGVNY